MAGEEVLRKGGDHQQTHKGKHGQATGTGGFNTNLKLASKARAQSASKSLDFLVNLT